MWTSNRFPAIWLLPALLPVILMTLYPIGHAFWTSLHEVMLLFPDQVFAGLKNYKRVVTSNYFRDALQNSLVFTLFAAPVVVVLFRAAVRKTPLLTCSTAGPSFP